MAKKIDVYTLGQFGVNRVKSPVHVQDGELLNAQNAQVKPVQGQLALSKRDGMATINSIAAAGSLAAIVNVPVWSLCITNPTVPDGSWYRGCWSSELNLFVITEFSSSSRVITSPDGEIWTERTAAGTQAWQDITYSPDLDLFVAVGGAVGAASTQVMTSPDGVTWTAATATSDRTWNAVAWSASLALFVAIASSGAAAGMVMTSPDGINWTAANASSSLSWRKVVWADALSLFVAVAESTGLTAQVMTSPNGTNWTTRDPGIATAWNDLVWSEELERLVAVGAPYAGGGGTTYSMYSSDGINWTAGNLSSSGAALTSLAYSPELEIFYHAGGAVKHISTDGITWTPIAAGCDQESITGVVYSPELEKFLVIGENSNGVSVFELVRNPL